VSARLTRTQPGGSPARTTSHCQRGCTRTTTSPGNLFRCSTALRRGLCHQPLLVSSPRGAVWSFPRTRLGASALSLLATYYYASWEALHWPRRLRLFVISF